MELGCSFSMTWDVHCRNHTICNNSEEHIMKSLWHESSSAHCNGSIVSTLSNSNRFPALSAQCARNTHNSGWGCMYAHVLEIDDWIKHLLQPPHQLFGFTFALLLIYSNAKCNHNIFTSLNDVQMFNENWQISIEKAKESAHNYGLWFYVWFL